MIKLSASVMCINPFDLKNEIISLDKSGIDQFHIDIMDGHFVPNFSLNAPIVSSIKQISKKVVDVHLMVDNPDEHIDSFIEAGADIIVPHIEALPHPIRTLKYIKNHGAKAGISINPSTDINNIPYLIDYLDVVCIMTVDPGFAGQKIIPSVYDKVLKLRKYAQSCGKDIDIMADGHIMEQTAPRLVEYGANVLVMGSSGLFNHSAAEYPQTIEYFKNLKCCGNEKGS